MNERSYQIGLINRLRRRFPGCHIMKNDPSMTQGIPDILILYRNTWAMLEVKVRDQFQPNQEHLVAHFNNMSYAAFISPENEEEVLNDLQSTFERARACIS